MIESNMLWSCECVDPHIGDRLNEEGEAEYMNLLTVQLLQIFRTTIRTDAEELCNGNWLKTAREELDRHVFAIDQYLNNCDEGCIIYGTEKIVVGEGSGPDNPGIRPHRIMHGQPSFAGREGFDEAWRPGLLYLRGRLIYLMKPYAPWDAMRGCDCHFIREACWMSEVALGYREDQKWGWQPYQIGPAGLAWLKEAETWEGEDFPR